MKSRPGNIDFLLYKNEDLSCLSKTYVKESHELACICNSIPKEIKTKESLRLDGQPGSLTQGSSRTMTDYISNKHEELFLRNVT